MQDHAARHPSTLDALIAPKSVAVIGASSDPARIGGRPIDFMKRHGFQGRILPVNPNRSEIQGLPAYASIDALPEAPDAAIVAVPGNLVLDAVAQLGRAGTRAAVVFSSGFAETGGAGVDAQTQLLALAREYDMRILGPNCAGMFNARVGYYPIFASTFAQSAPPPGRIGLAGQSGAYCTHLYELAKQRGLGISVCATTGNEMDVDVADLIHWLAQDPETDVIAAYSEGFKDGKRLIAALQAAQRARKPVIMMKVGRSALGAQAVQSHTAAIAGDDAVADAVLSDLGVIRASSIENMLDIVYAATRKIFPVDKTLGVISISGGVGILASDAAEEAGLSMPAMPETSQQRLKQLVPFASPKNPVDCTAQAINDPSIVGAFAKEMVQEGYASVLAFLSTSGGPVMSRAILEQLTAIKTDYPDRLFTVSLIGNPEITEAYEAAGFLVFEDPTRAIIAIEAMARLGQSFKRVSDKPDAAENGEIFSVPHDALNEAQAKHLLASAGIAITPERVCQSAEEAAQAAEALGYPVVMKILSAELLHKSDIGGVLLNVSTEQDVRQGFHQLLRVAAEHQPPAKADGVLVAKMLHGGVETIMGITRDPVFGPVAMFGLGGIFVEVLKDVVLRPCPFDEDTAREMILSIRGAALLQGARGRPATDIDALACMLSRLSHFAVKAGPRLASVDLNPVLAMPDGQGAYAADAVLVAADDR